MEKIYRVFVSSTYEDLREERSEVQKALLKLKCLPVGMELFPSTDDENWEFIKRQIEESDYYILVIGGRYGSLAPDGLSYTEKEYRYARELKMPVLAFVHADRSVIPAGKTELDAEPREKLEQFIKTVRTGPLVQSYTTAHELSAQVIVSMVELRERRPAIGYIRANESVEAKKYADLLEENARLKAEIASANNTYQPFALAHQDANLLLSSGLDAHESHCTWGEIFVAIAARIVLWPDFQDGHAAEAVLALAGGTKLDFRAGEFQRVKMQLFAMQLVRFETVLKQGSARYLDRTYHVWHLTEYGSQQIGALARLNPLPPAPAISGG